MRGSAQRHRRDRTRVHPADRVSLSVMLVITATLYLSRLGGMPVEHWPEIHLAMLLAYLVLSGWMARGGDEPWVPRVRAGAVIALMFSLYSTLGHAVFAAVPWSGDAALNAIDQWLFGGVPPALLAEAFVTRGRVEFFSFCYAFFIPYLYLSILTGLVGRPDAERQRFVTGFALLYAISFLGYLFVPARGPIVYNALEFAAPLAGGAFHGLVVQVIDAAGGPHGAFPSLHVGASAYACLFDFRYNRLRGLTYLPLVGLIAMATVLLRYHYVIDLLAGLLLALLAAVLSHRWMARWEKEKAEAA